MKKSRFSKQLTLKKVTISKLGDSEMRAVKGAGTIPIPYSGADWLSCKACPM